MKKIIALSLMTLLFTITSASAQPLTIPDLPIPDLGDLGGLADNSVISLPNDEADSPTDNTIDDVTTQPETLTSETQTEQPASTTSFLLWGGIIVVLAGGLYLYLAKKDKY